MIIVQCQVCNLIIYFLDKLEQFQIWNQHTIGQCKSASIFTDKTVKLSQNGNDIYCAYEDLQCKNCFQFIGKLYHNSTQKFQTPLKKYLLKLDSINIYDCKTQQYLDKLTIKDNQQQAQIETPQKKHNKLQEINNKIKEKKPLFFNGFEDYQSEFEQNQLKKIQREVLKQILKSEEYLQKFKQLVLYLQNRQQTLNKISERLFQKLQQAKNKLIDNQI
ncbi:hypothetical protein ABPG73_012017 [Tetrahymena malaccensis]